MKQLDKFCEKTSRHFARQSSRRSFLARLGMAVVGAAAIPLLPVARASTGGNAYPGVAPQNTGNPQDPGDPTQCEYWRYCAVDGFLLINQYLTYTKNQKSILANPSHMTYIFGS